MTRSLLLLALVLTGCRKAPPQVLTQAEVVHPNLGPNANTVTGGVVDQLVANFKRVHFSLDSATLDAGSREALSANAQIMQRYPSVVVEVQGHADERGTTDYNLALGQRRADAVRRYLVLQGVPDNRIRPLSYGEERPAALGHDERAWSANRRAEFRILTGSGVQGTTESR